MALILYRRHDAVCTKKLTDDLKLDAKAQRHYLDCECLFWIMGKTDKLPYGRRPTGQRDFKAAQAVFRSLNEGAKDEAVYGPKIDDCIRRYIDSRKSELGERAEGHYTLVLGWLKEYADSRDHYYMDDLSTDFLADFVTYRLGHLKSTTRSTYVAKLKQFITEAAIRGWITKQIIIKSIEAVYEAKLPYTDGNLITNKEDPERPANEIALIMAEAKMLSGGTNGYASNPETFTLMLRLLLETGLRVSDGVTFNSRKLAWGTTRWIYSFYPWKHRKGKTRKLWRIYLSDDLKKAIDACKWFSAVLPFAYNPISKDPEQANRDVEAMGAACLERMKNIGKRCGVADCRPHRLRDTFAVRLLVAGYTLEDVSRLLCHSSVAVTEKYYAPWIKDREDRLEGRLAMAFNNP